MRAVLGLMLLFCLAFASARAADVYVQKMLVIEGVTITATAFSQDGSRIAFAQADGPVSIRDTATNAEVLALAWPGKRTGSMAFSADGQRLAMISSAKDLSLWDLGTGQMLAEATTAEPLARIAFSPDGATLMGPGQDGRIHLFNAATLAATKTIGVEGALVSDGAFSPDGKSFATVDLDKMARLWDLASGAETARFPHDVYLNGVSFNQDGTRLATAGRDGEVRVFDVFAAREILRFTAGEGDINDVAFSPDGTRFATASTEDTIDLWDAKTGAAIVSLKGHLGDVVSVSFGTDSQTLYSRAHDATGRVWTLSAAQAAGDLSALAGLWRQSIELPEGETLPPEVIGPLCQAPVKVQANGLVIMYEVYPPDPPRPSAHFRCAPDMTCTSFAGEPAQGLASYGTAELKLEAGKLSLCGNGECLVHERCDPATAVWGPEEITAGYDKVWAEAMGKAWD
jgi:WD40 repeat protein